MLLTSIVTLALASVALARDPNRLSNSRLPITARDNIHKPTYITAFNYSVIKIGPSFLDGYTVNFYQDGGDSFECATNRQTSDPTVINDYPSAMQFNCLKADGSYVTDPNMRVYISPTRPLRPSGARGLIQQSVDLLISPKIPEGYEFYRADIFKDGKFTCSYNGVPPFTCSLAGTSPKLRLEEITVNGG